MSHGGGVHVIDHPLVQHKLTKLRDIHTGPKDFRELMEEIGMLMAYEVTRDIATEPVEVQTPVAVAQGRIVSGKKLAVVAILRAGLGMLGGVLRLVPAAKVGHFGVYRDPDTLNPVQYYCKLPQDIGERDVIVIDPMLATGGSAAAALDYIKRRGGTSLKLLALVAAPEGIARVHKDHPEVPIFVAAVDERLNEHAYIVPGLGDAGDRLYGTR
ncbi:MAG: uracil phosphoribosyltransferase [Firmicutes bacterium ZCTH02-B6]|nr:MAG: uracil phosphoribosyltransferase [Firmicutes bacterium ZCTH02-B6]